MKTQRRNKQKYVFSATLLTLALAVAAALLVGSATAKTITVDDDPGMADYEHIQDAVNAASPGDTIYVFEGLYIEHVVVDKWDSLQLIGDDRENVVIDGGWSGTCLTIKNWIIKFEMKI